MAMKDINEIKLRKLEIYDSREKLLKIINNDTDITSDIIKAAQNCVITAYNVAINELDWVLNENKNGKA